MSARPKEEITMGKHIGLALGAFALCISAPRAQAPGETDAKQSAAKNCIRVELMMYSGRPRPQYLLCEDDKKEETVRRLKAAVEGTPAGALEPLESTPAYQGMIITLPKGETRAPRRSFIGKGKVNNLDSKSAYRTDSNHELERYFLDLAETKKDMSMPGQEESMQALVGGIKSDLNKTK
ncbi:MAG: hypothetical protein JWO30_4955 [Fibrobacteres bacterium]|nr:hypothetical protein [Fibrobacterota bacterium]